MALSTIILDFDKLPSVVRLDGLQWDMAFLWPWLFVFADLAFSPMPTISRLNAYSERADFALIKADRLVKTAAAEVTLEQLDHLG